MKKSDLNQMKQIFLNVGSEWRSEIAVPDDATWLQILDLISDVTGISQYSLVVTIPTRTFTHWREFETGGLAEDLNDGDIVFSLDGKTISFHFIKRQQLMSEPFDDGS